MAADSSLGGINSRMTLDISDYLIHLERAQNATGNMASNISGAGAAGSRGIGNLTAQFGLMVTGVEKAIQYTAKLFELAGAPAVNFQKEMQNVATLLGGNVTKRVGELGESVKTLSKDTGVSTTLLTDGLYQVVSAFGDTADSAKNLETAAKGAAAGNATVTDSVNLLSAVTKGYGDTSAEAVQKASDLSFLTVKLGQTTFPELAASMGGVIPIAGAMKISQEELFGAMATLTGVTGNSAEVTTQLRAVIQGFMQPSKEMEEALQGIGYATGAAALESLGMDGALSQLKDSVGGNTLGLAGLFGSVEAGTAVLALSGSQADNFKEKTKAMGEAAGESQKAFETQQASVSAMAQKISAYMDVILIGVGEKVLPKLMELLEWVINKMPVIEATVENMANAIGIAFEFIVEQVTIVIDFYKRHETAINSLAIGIGVAALVFGVYALAMNAAAIATGIWSAVTSVGIAVGTAFGAVMAFILSPIGAAVIAIGVLVAAGVYLYKNWDQVKEVAVFVFEYIASFINNKIKYVRDIFVSFIDGVKAFGNGVVGRIWDGIAEKAQWLFSKVTSFVSGIANTIKDYLGIDLAVKKLAKYGENIGAGISSGIKSSYEWVIGATEGTVEKVKGVFEGPKGKESEIAAGKTGEELGKALKNGMAGTKPEEAVKVAMGKVKSEFELSKTWIADRKYYNELSLQEELEAWERVQARYMAGTEERKEADKEVYRVKQELIKKQEEYDKEYSDINNKYNENLLNETNKYEQSKKDLIAKSNKEIIELEEDTRDANIKVNRERILSIEKENKKYAEDREKVFKDLGKALTKLEESYNDDIEKINSKRQDSILAEDKRFEASRVKVLEESENRKLKLEQDYQKAYDSLIEKANKSINDANQAYIKALGERESALYNFMGIFDKVGDKETVSGQELLSNLDGQVQAFSNWQVNIQELVSKGLDEGVVQELRDLGPKSSAEIAALTTLTEDELVKYAELWKTKHELARTESVSQLEDLRKETDETLQNIDNDTVKNLQNLNDTYNENLKQINKDTETEMLTMKNEHTLKLREIDTNSNNDLITLNATYTKNLTNINTENREKLLEMEKNHTNKLSDINTNSDNDLQTIKSTYEKKLGEINKETNTKLLEMEKEHTRNLRTITINTSLHLEKLEKVYDTHLEDIRVDSKTKLEELTKNAKDETENMVTGISDKIEEKKVLITGPNGTLEGMRTDMATILATCVKDATTAGEDFTLGFKKGIVNKLSEIQTQVTNMVNSIKRTMEQALEMQSPSKVMERMGENVVDGLVNGIAGRGRSVTDAMKRLSGSISGTTFGFNGGLSSGVYGNNSSGAKTINLNVTQNISDRKTADYATKSLTKVLQGRGMREAFI